VPVYVIEYLEVGMELMFQIHSVTSSREYARDISLMLLDREDIIEAGYSDWKITPDRG